MKFVMYNLNFVITWILPLQNWYNDVSRHCTVGTSQKMYVRKSTMRSGNGNATRSNGGRHVHSA